VIWLAELPPFVAFYVAALLAGLTRGRIRVLILLAAPLLGGLQLLGIEPGVEVQTRFLGYELIPFRVDKLSQLFGYLFHIGAFLAIVFSLHVRDTLQHVAGLCYAGSALGAVFAGDLITLFLYWELMALFSTVIVWCGGTPAARAAGIRYAIMHLLGGVVLKVGIEGVVVGTGSVQIRPMLATDFNTWMILIGILINAAAPPISSSVRSLPLLLHLLLTLT